MSQRILRLSQLATEKGRCGLLPVGPATVWRWVKAGTFPKPFKLSQGITVWDAEEVEAFIAKRKAVEVGA